MESIYTTLGGFKYSCSWWAEWMSLLVNKALVLPIFSWPCAAWKEIAGIPSKTILVKGMNPSQLQIAAPLLTGCVT